MRSCMKGAPPGGGVAGDDGVAAGEGVGGEPLPSGIADWLGLVAS
jgi:hypothetical protein